MKNINKVAITGASGFVAHGLIEVLISKKIEINAISRNESKLIKLKSEFPSVKIFPCQIEDKYLLQKAINDCDGIFHLASFKDVILSREHPLKTTQTNILGSINVLQASVDNPKIKFVIGTSTDKTAKVSSVYGASKFIMESLFEEFEKINPTKCKYRIVRCGNILYSTYSVLVKWKDAILNNKEIIITNPEATRFFWTRDEAVNFLFDCLDNSVDSKPYIPTMKSIDMGTLLNAMIEKYGNNQTFKIKHIGLQKGENMHEFLTDQFSSLDSERWSKENLMNVI